MTRLALALRPLLRLLCWLRGYHRGLATDHDTCRCGATWERDGGRSWWVWSGGIALLLALATPAAQASIGYTPPVGSQSCLYTGFNGGGQRACYAMDLSSDPFVGGLTNAELQRRAEARYGHNFHGTDASRPRFLALDFESLLGKGPIYLRHLWTRGYFGGPHLDGWATLTETHDFFAVNPHEASRAMAYVEPGPPPPTPTPTPVPTTAPTPTPPPGNDLGCCPPCQQYREAALPKPSPALLEFASWLETRKGLTRIGPGRQPLARDVAALVRAVAEAWPMYLPSELSTGVPARPCLEEP